MKKLSLKTAVTLSMTTILLGACAGNPMHPSNYSNVSSTSDNQCDQGTTPVAQRYLINNKGRPAQAIKIRVTGYGAPPKTFYPDPQRRLMAMRAAKIDAYRSLAERVAGIQIWGGTTVGDMVVEKDRFRVYLDTTLTGARVIAENPQDDGTYETVVELKVGQEFLDETLPKKVSMNCRPQENRNTDYKMTKENLHSAENDQGKLSLTHFYVNKD